jgi:hypothetical protein
VSTQVGISKGMVQASRKGSNASSVQKGLETKDLRDLEDNMCEPRDGRDRSTPIEGSLTCGMNLRSQTSSYLRLIDFVYHAILGLRVMRRSPDGRDRSTPMEVLMTCGMNLHFVSPPWDPPRTLSIGLR